ncbi:MAG TPA: cation transporter [Solirubrobacteraceae bacterium]|nr:cation transporter [Solirubrobacteraceae bacterium]
MASTDRHALLHRALQLSWLSVGFGLVAGSVSVGSGLAEHSLGVLAAGLSVLADVTGSVVLIWRFRVERSDPVRASEVEDRAALAVATALGVIGAALAYESIHALIEQSHPGSGGLAIITSAISFAVLAPLALNKRRVAVALHSHALRGDSTLSAIGASTAVFALAGLLLDQLFGWWWADRGVALVIAAVAVFEARTLLRAEHAPD